MMIRLRIALLILFCPPVISEGSPIVRLETSSSRMRSGEALLTRATIETDADTTVELRRCFPSFESGDVYLQIRPTRGDWQHVRQDLHKTQACDASTFGPNQRRSVYKQVLLRPDRTQELATENYELRARVVLGAETLTSNTVSIIVIHNNPIPDLTDTEQFALEYLVAFSNYRHQVVLDNNEILIDVPLKDAHLLMDKLGDCQTTSLVRSSLNVFNADISVKDAIRLSEQEPNELLQEWFLLRHAHKAFLQNRFVECEEFLKELRGESSISLSLWEQVGYFKAGLLKRPANGE